MAHITLNNDLPGLLGLLAHRPHTAEPMIALMQTLMEGPGTLSLGERELIGSVAASANDCTFCTEAHGAFAAANLEGGTDAVRRAQTQPTDAGQSPRVQALINIALAATKSGQAVSTELVSSAKAAGATEDEVHDAVLIASAFALFTRYVDGLATFVPGQGSGWYDGMAQQLTQGGYAGIAQMIRGSAQPMAT